MARGRKPSVTIVVGLVVMAGVIVGCVWATRGTEAPVASPPPPPATAPPSHASTTTTTWSEAQAILAEQLGEASAQQAGEIDSGLLADPAAYAAYRARTAGQATTTTTTTSTTSAAQGLPFFCTGNLAADQAAPRLPATMDGDGLPLCADSVGVFLFDGAWYRVS